jgi:hypothetical protein
MGDNTSGSENSASDDSKFGGGNESSGGHDPDPHDVFSRMRDMAAANQLPTIEPLLPVLLNLRGKPFSLKDHFHFAPLFRTRRPQRILLTVARQIGKSTVNGADCVALAGMIPHFSTLCITPLYEQIRRFSTLVIRPFVMESPLRELWLGTNVESSVLQRTFRNGSKLMFSFASVDAGRIRGLSVNRISYDEIDDIEKDVIPVIRETISADRVYGMEFFAGTPKSTDGTQAKLQSQSSHAEWWIPCQHCTTNGFRTWNIPSTEYHIMKMIGPLRDDISPERPGIVCYKCQQPLYPRMGHWEHRYPEKRWDFTGYHIPQPIVPLHYDNVRKWAELLLKQRTQSPALFANEVLAEPQDAGQRLVSQRDLMNACSLPWENTPDSPHPQLMARLSQYRTRVLAIDWGGGGEAGVSFTVFALLGFMPDGTIEVGWAKMLLGVDHIAEAKEAAKWFRYFDCHVLTHDYTGAGTLRETLLKQAGLPQNRDMPIQYVASAHQNLLVSVQPSESHLRPYWRLDKTRSLHYTIAMIRLGLLRFFKYDNLNTDNPGLVDHFMRLTEHRSPLEIGCSYYSIRSNTAGPDDFAQAVNIGCVCTWEINDAYPKFANAASLQLTPDMLAQIGSPDHDWESDPHLSELLD